MALSALCNTHARAYARTHARTHTRARAGTHTHVFNGNMCAYACLQTENQAAKTYICPWYTPQGQEHEDVCDLDLYSELETTGVL